MPKSVIGSLLHRCCLNQSRRKVLLVFVLMIFVVSITASVADSGSMIVTYAGSTYAITIEGPARSGAYLRARPSCKPDNPSCTFTLQKNGLIVSGSDPKLAISAVGGAKDGVELKLAACKSTQSECLWSLTNDGKIINRKNPRLAISAYGGADNQNRLRLKQDCVNDCKWAIVSLSESSSKPPETTSKPPEPPSPPLLIPSNTELSFFEPTARRFLSVKPDGTSTATYSRQSIADFDPGWRDERFIAIDAGGGRMAIYSVSYDGLVTVNDLGLLVGGVKGKAMPPNWTQGLFQTVLVASSSDKSAPPHVRLFQPDKKCVVIINPKNKLQCYVSPDGRPAGADQVSPTGFQVSRPPAYVARPNAAPPKGLEAHAVAVDTEVALYHVQSQAFLGLDRQGNVTTRHASTASDFSPEWTAERFKIVDASGCPKPDCGPGRVALLHPSTNRYLRIQADKQVVGSKPSDSSFYGSGFTFLDIGQDGTVPPRKKVILYSNSRKQMVRISNGHGDVVDANTDKDMKPFAPKDEYETFVLVEAPRDDFYMAIMSDPQYPWTKSSDGEAAKQTEEETAEESKDLNRKRVRSIHALAADVGLKKVKGVIMNGDLTGFMQKPQLDTFQEIYAGLTIPQYLGLGNHDYFNNVDDCYQNNCATRAVKFMRDHVLNTVRPLDFDFYQYTSFESILQKNFEGSLAYSWEIGNVHFVQLQYYPLYGRSWNGKTDDSLQAERVNITSALSWLKHDLAKARKAGRVIILNYHAPENWLAPMTGWINPTSQSDIDEFKSALTTYHVSAVFAGHIHLNVGKSISAYVPTEIPFFYCGAVSHQKYLFVHFNGSKMDVQTVVDGEKPAAPTTHVLYETIDEVKVPPRDGRVIFHNDAGYVARYSLTYKVDGVPQSKSTERMAVGNKRFFKIPGNATDIQVKGEGDTGFGWRSTFAKSLDSVPTACFRSWGTTLDQKWDNVCKEVK